MFDNTTVHICIVWVDAVLSGKIKQESFSTLLKAEARHTLYHWNLTPPVALTVCKEDNKKKVLICW